MPTFDRLNRTALRKLQPGESIAEHGIVYTRLAGDGRWSVNVMVARTRHHIVIGLESEGFTRTQAEEKIASLKAGKREASHGVKSTRAVRALTVSAAVDDYLDYLRAHGGKDVDVKARRFRQHLVPALGALRLASLTDDDWKRYAADRKTEGAAPGTINRERSALLHLLNTARRRKLLAALPPLLERMAEPPGRIVYLSPDEAQRLLQAARIDDSRHAHPFVMIALYTGMRHSPILNLRARDVDCARRALWVAQDKAGRREQAMPKILADYLAQLIAGMDPDALLFASKRAKSGRVYQMNSIFDRCVKRAGLAANVTPHTLRHTAASNAAHAGLDAATIQAMGGWKTRQMAERYTHAAQMTGAMDALEQRLSGSTVTQKLPGPPVDGP